MKFKTFKIKFFLVILASVLFNSCEFFTTLFNPKWNEPIHDWFDEYTNTAAIEKEELSQESYSDDAGHRVINSNTDLDIYFYLRNPQCYRLKLEGVSEEMTDGYDEEWIPSDLTSSEYVFDIDSVNRDVVGIYQTDLTTIWLHIPQTALVSYDEGKVISPTIYITEPKSGREFTPFVLDLYCNSVPPDIYNLTVLNDSNNYFALAFDMPSKEELKMRHKDICAVEIDGVSYECSIDEDGNYSFTDDRFTYSYKVSYSALNGKVYEHNDRSVYFDTRDVFEETEKEYSLVLKDKAGLFSSANANTTITKLKMPELYDAEKNQIEYESSIAVPFISGKDYSQVNIKAPVKDHLGDAINGDALVSYKLFYGKSSVAVLRDSGTFTGEKTFDLIAGTWRIEASATLLNYDKSSLAGATVRAVDSCIYISSADGDDINGEGTMLFPYKTFDAAYADINDRNDDTVDYILRICGSFDNIQIPSDLIAKSVKIEGGTLDTAGETFVPGSTDIETLVCNKTTILKNVSVGDKLTVPGGVSVTLGSNAVIKDCDVSGALRFDNNSYVSGSTKIISSGNLEIIGELMGNTISPSNYVAVITPDAYEVGRRIFELTDYYLDNYRKFNLVQDSSTPDTNWSIASDGTLKQVIEEQIIITPIFADCDGITVTYDETQNPIVFTAESGFDSYVWKFDGEILDEHGAVYTLDTSALVSGVYDIVLLATKTNEQGNTVYYSYHLQIKKN